MRVLIFDEIEYDNKIKHCCELMSQFLLDPRIRINYFKKFRGYYLDTTSGAYQTIFHCPFCCSKLPQNLMEEYYKILEKEYNIDDPHDEEQENIIPEEFKSDEWWKKRNL